MSLIILLSSKGKLLYTEIKFHFQRLISHRDQSALYTHKSRVEKYWILEYFSPIVKMVEVSFYHPVCVD
jgi:hypothetical protein